MSTTGSETTGGNPRRRRRRRWLAMWAPAKMIGNGEAQVKPCEVVLALRRTLGDQTEVKFVAHDEHGLRFEILTDRPAEIVHVVVDWLGLRSPTMWRPVLN